MALFAGGYCLRVLARWAKPARASRGVGVLDQQADAVGEIAGSKCHELLHIRNRQRHRLAQQRLAVCWWTARTAAPPATAEVNSPIQPSLRPGQVDGVQATGASRIAGRSASCIRS